MFDENISYSEFFDRIDIQLYTTTGRIYLTTQCPRGGKSIYFDPHEKRWYCVNPKKCKCQWWPCPQSGNGFDYLSDLFLQRISFHLLLKKEEMPNE